METEMKFEDRSPWHHLIFCEEFFSDKYENDVVCWLCEAPVLGHPVYKCLECNFLQHKSCSGNELMYWHWRHHLILLEEMENSGKEEVVCLKCNEPASVPAYKCSHPDCTFLLHKSCTQLPLVIQHPQLLPDHILTLQAPSTINLCDACREYCSRSLFYRNYLRDFDLDIQCVSRWRVSADDCDPHVAVPLLKQVKFSCGACGEESQDIPYICSVCRILTHRNCAQFQHIINTRVHKHPLTRTYFVRRVTKQDRIFCKLCRTQVNSESGAYYCKECDYITHLKCAPQFQSTSLSPGDDANHFVYLMEGMHATQEERVGPKEIQHSSHSQHNLILIHEEQVIDKRCEACLQLILFSPFYGCIQCKFFLHSRCAKLPPTLWRGLFHEHPLTLHLEQPSTNSLFCCGSCGRFRHGFFYKCDECSDFKLDIQCCLIPETLQHHLHGHTLFLVVSRRGKCSCCGRSYELWFKDWKSRLRHRKPWFENWPLWFNCIDCDFNLCFNCVTFPSVSRYRYDKHLLKLHVPCGDDFKKNYCLICEEKRDPRDPFYYCEKCNFAAHSDCVVGKHPWVKLGITCIDETYHQHSFVTVETTEHSPSCKACGDSFKIDGHFKLGDYRNVALECTQCPFIICSWCWKRKFR